MMPAKPPSSYNTQKRDFVDHHQMPASLPNRPPAYPSLPTQPRPKNQSQNQSHADLERLKKLKEDILKGQHPYYHPDPHPEVLEKLSLIHTPPEPAHPQRRLHSSDQQHPVHAPSNPARIHQAPDSIDNHNERYVHSPDDNRRRDSWEEKSHGGVQRGLNDPSNNSKYTDNIDNNGHLSTNNHDNRPHTPISSVPLKTRDGHGLRSLPTPQSIPSSSGRNGGDQQSRSNVSGPGSRQHDLRNDDDKNGYRTSTPTPINPAGLNTALPPFHTRPHVEQRPVESSSSSAQIATNSTSESARPSVPQRLPLAGDKSNADNGATRNGQDIQRSSRSREDDLVSRTVVSSHDARPAESGPRSYSRDTLASVGPSPSSGDRRQESRSAQVSPPKEPQSLRQQQEPFRGNGRYESSEQVRAGDNGASVAVRRENVDRVPSGPRAYYRPGEGPQAPTPEAHPQAPVDHGQYDPRYPDDGSAGGRRLDARDDMPTKPRESGSSHPAFVRAGGGSGKEYPAVDESRKSYPPGAEIKDDARGNTLPTLTHPLPSIPPSANGGRAPTIPSGPRSAVVSRDQDHQSPAARPQDARFIAPIRPARDSYPTGPAASRDSHYPPTQPRDGGPYNNHSRDILPPSDPYFAPSTPKVYPPVPAAPKAYPVAENARYDQGDSSRRPPSPAHTIPTRRDTNYSDATQYPPSSQSSMSDTRDWRPREDRDRPATSSVRAPPSPRDWPAVDVRGRRDPEPQQQQQQQPSSKQAWDRDPRDVVEPRGIGPARERYAPVASGPPDLRRVSRDDYEPPRAKVYPPPSSALAPLAPKAWNGPPPQTQPRGPPPSEPYAPRHAEPERYIPTPPVAYREPPAQYPRTNIPLTRPRSPSPPPPPRAGYNSGGYSRPPILESEAARAAKRARMDEEYNRDYRASLAAAATAANGGGYPGPYNSGARPPPPAIHSQAPPPPPSVNDGRLGYYDKRGPPPQAAPRDPGSYTRPRSPAGYDPVRYAPSVPIQHRDRDGPPLGPASRYPSQTWDRDSPSWV